MRVRVNGRSELDQNLTKKGSMSRRKPKVSIDEMEVALHKAFSNKRILQKCDTFESLFNYCAEEARKRYFKRYGSKKNSRF